MLKVENLDLPENEDARSHFIAETSLLRDSLQWTLDEVKKAFGNASFDDFFEEFCRGEEILQKVVMLYEGYYRGMQYRHREEIEEAWQEAYVDEGWFLQK